MIARILGTALVLAIIAGCFYAASIGPDDLPDDAPPDEREGDG